MDGLKLLLVICASFFSVSAQSEDRLSKIEASLELVLEKNAELEQYIKQLEKKNDALEVRVYNLEKKQVITVNANNGRPNVNPSRVSEAEQQTQIKRQSKRQLTDATVAFTAVVTPDELTLGPGHPIVFDQAITNVGGFYHTTTGIFTAPVAGVYVFNIAIMVDPGQYEYVELVKDGQHVIWTFPHGAHETHVVSTSKTTTLELVKGSEVWVRTQNTSQHGTGHIHGNTFTTFSGFLIAITE